METKVLIEQKPSFTIQHLAVRLAKHGLAGRCDIEYMGNDIVNIKFTDIVNDAEIKFIKNLFIECDFFRSYNIFSIHLNKQIVLRNESIKII